MEPSEIDRHLDHRRGERTPPIRASPPSPRPSRRRCRAGPASRLEDGVRARRPRGHPVVRGGAVGVADRRRHRRSRLQRQVAGHHVDPVSGLQEAHRAAQPDHPGTDHDHALHGHRVCYSHVTPVTAARWNHSKGVSMPRLLRLVYRPVRPHPARRRAPRCRQHLGERARGATNAQFPDGKGHRPSFKGYDNPNSRVVCRPESRARIEKMPASQRKRLNLRLIRALRLRIDPGRDQQHQEARDLDLRAARPLRGAQVRRRQAQLLLLAPRAPPRARRSRAPSTSAASPPPRSRPSPTGWPPGPTRPTRSACRTPTRSSARTTST